MEKKELEKNALSDEQMENVTGGLSLDFQEAVPQLVTDENAGLVKIIWCPFCGEELQENSEWLANRKICPFCGHTL